MKLQLILYPQNYKGATVPLNSAPQEMVVAGERGVFHDAFYSTSYVNPWPLSGLPMAQSGLNYYNAVSMGTGYWGKYMRTINGITVNWNSGCDAYLNFKFKQCGVVQRLSGLIVGDLYNVEIGIVDTAWTTCAPPNSDPAFTFYHATGNNIIGTYPLSGYGIQTCQFTAASTTDFIMLDFLNSDSARIGRAYQVSVKNQTTVNNYADFLDTGEVICDLYEDEDIPLTLSIDDFKNVAEKVQSYSKAFMLPGTKRNNQIFANIFDVTRFTNSVATAFNPYMKTQCILKQDGFILFEGYLRLLNITDKEGEISYNVNLYSEVIALADLLKERKFSDLDLSELDHTYEKNSIKKSWYDDATGTGLPLDTALPTTSYAYSSSLGTMQTGVLKYPFVDWAHQYAVTSGGDPELLSLDDTFRPWLQLRYLINKIFENTPFTWSSSFFDSADFRKLFMDFNWASRQIETGIGKIEVGDPAVWSTGSWLPLTLYNTAYPASAGFDEATGTFTATADGTNYYFNGTVHIANYYYCDNAKIRWVHRDAAGGYIQSQDITVWASNWYPGIIPIPVNFYRTLQAGESIQFYWYQSSWTGASGDAVLWEGTWLKCTMNQMSATTQVLTQTLRGELGQWDFLKGILNMFNLVTLPNESDNTIIEIEPYPDIFINNSFSGTTSDLTLASRGIAHDWTEKMDITEHKLSPLADLNLTTKFVWEIDDDDYFWNLYKKSTQHEYGSLTYTATGFNVLIGTEEITGSPFAATLSKPLMPAYSTLVIPTLYSLEDDGTTKGFDNSPRICYDNGRTQLPHTYYIPAQNGSSSENQQWYGRFSHLTEIPAVGTSRDFLWGEQQYASGAMGPTTVNNLFNLYWLPYLSELYNADTKTITLKMNLSPADINTFKFYDTVFLKQREYRVNKIDYVAGDLATVEFILIP